MKNRKLLVVVSVLVVLGLIIGACTKPSTTSTAPTKPGTSVVPAPSPSPKPSPSPTASPSPSPKPAPTTAPPPAQPAVIKWKNQASYAGIEPPERFKKFGYYGSGHSGVFLGDVLKKITGGRLIIETTPPGSIVPGGDVFNAVKQGTLDVAWHAFAGAYTGIIPEGFVEIGLTYAWLTANEMWDGMVQFGMQDIIREAYAEHGVWVQSTPEDGRYTWFTNFEPKSLDAFKGKKLRSWGMNADWLKAIGAVPVALPAPETYMAMKLGTIDGMLYDAAQSYVEKLNETVKYIVADPRTTGPVGWSYLINKKSLDALPADLKVIVTETLPALTYYFTRYYANHDEWAFNVLTAKGKAGDLVNGYLPLSWSDADKAKAYDTAVTLWDELAKKSPRVKKLVDILKTQIKEIGRIK